MTAPISITAVIIVRNEEQQLDPCIETLQWCSAILVVDNGSDDDSVAIAERAGATVLSIKSQSFSRVREEALKHIKTDWVFYIDADERVTPTLAKEIQVLIETNSASVLQLQRKNYFFGYEMQHGGWQTDLVTRVFKVTALRGWYGTIHESPQFTGPTKLVVSPLIHLTHRSVVDNLHKSAAWTPLEAQAYLEVKTPPITFFTILRKGSMEFIRRAFFQKGYKDGMPGLIEALIQGINRMWVYIQVWELQQDPSIPERYAFIEKEIKKKWKQE